MFTHARTCTVHSIETNRRPICAQYIQHLRRRKACSWQTVLGIMLADATRPCSRCLATQPAVSVIWTSTTQGQQIAEMCRMYLRDAQLCPLLNQVHQSLLVDLDSLEGNHNCCGSLCRCCKLQVELHCRGKRLGSATYASGRL